MTGSSRSIPISRSYSIFLVLVSCLLLITFTHSEAFVPRRKTSYKDFWETVQLNYTKKNLKADSKKTEDQKTPKLFRSSVTLSSAPYFFILLFRYAASIFS